MKLEKLRKKVKIFGMKEWKKVVKESKKKEL